MRCICCGKDLVCCCCRCCGSSSSKKPKDAKHLGSAPPTPYHTGFPNNQYQSHAQPVYQNNAFSQTATFEGKVHEDSLPAMPSWETAASRKIEVEEPPETLEMNRLKHDASPLSGTISPPARPIPMRNGSGHSMDNRSPRLPNQGLQTGRSPYGQQSGYGSTQNFNSRTNLNEGYDSPRANHHDSPGGYGNNSYGNDRYNSNTGGGSTNDYFTQGNGGTGAGYNRSPRSPGGYAASPITHSPTPGYDYNSGGHSNNNNTSNYNTYSGASHGVYGNPSPDPRSAYGNQSPRPGNQSPRPAAYPGQAAYGNTGPGAAGQRKPDWRDL